MKARYCQIFKAVKLKMKGNIQGYKNGIFSDWQHVHSHTQSLQFNVPVNVGFILRLNQIQVIKWGMLIYIAHEQIQRVLLNRLIEEELGDRARKETVTFGNGMV